MLKSTKLTMILEQGKAKNKLISIKTNDVKPVGELTSVEIEGMKAEELAKTDDKDKAAVTAKYDLIAAAQKQKELHGDLRKSKLTRGQSIRFDGYKYI
jgi:hypothetical protein